MTALRIDASGDVEIAESTATPRRWHTLELLPDGRALAIGGEGAGGALESTEIYDPVTGQWTSGPSLPAPRMSHASTRLPGDIILVTGGTAGGAPTTTAYVLDEDWSDAGSMTNAQARHEMVGALVIGNNSEVWNGTFGNATFMFRPRRFFAAAAVTGGAVAIGGEPIGESGAIAHVERYDSAAKSWAAVAPLRRARRHHTATTLADGSVLVVGGADPDAAEQPSTTAERYDVEADRWDDAPPPPISFVRHTATLLEDGSVLFIGAQGAARFVP
jgi:N-acetylneuraminic acid mutarotase